MDALRLYLDEDITDTLARVLRGKGFDVISSHEVGMDGSSDEEQLQYSTREGRALVSFNIADFAELARQWFEQEKEHCGIVVSPQIDLKQMVRLTTNMLHRVTASEMKNGFDWLQNYS